MSFIRPNHRREKIHKFGHMHLDDYSGAGRSVQERADHLGPFQHALPSAGSAPRDGGEAAAPAARARTIVVVARRRGGSTALRICTRAICDIEFQDAGSPLRLPDSSPRGQTAMSYLFGLPLTLGEAVAVTAVGVGTAGLAMFLGRRWFLRAEVLPTASRPDFPLQFAMPGARRSGGHRRSAPATA